MILSELHSRIRSTFPGAKVSIKTEILDDPTFGTDVDLEVYVWPPNRTIHVRAHTPEDAWRQIDQARKDRNKEVIRSLDVHNLARRERA